MDRHICCSRPVMAPSGHIMPCYAISFSITLNSHSLTEILTRALTPKWLVHTINSAVFSYKRMSHSISEACTHRILSVPAISYRFITRHQRIECVSSFGKVSDPGLHPSWHRDCGAAP